MLNSVKGKFVIFTSGLIIFTMLLTSIIIYSQLSDGIQHSVEEDATSTVQDVERFIQTYLEKYQLTVSMLAEDPRTIDFLEGSDTVAEQNATWNSLVSSYESFMDREAGAQLTYIGTGEGEMVSTPQVDLPDDFDPRERPWYQDAISELGEVIWTAPYIDIDTEELVITVAQSVSANNNDEILGVQAIDLSLDEMVSLLETTEISNQGKLALIDEEGIIIAHRDSSQVGEAVSEDEQLALIVNSEDVVGKVQSGGETAYFNEVDGYGWKVVTVYEDKNLFAELTNTRNTFIIVSIVAIIIAFITSYYATSKLTNPIRKLNVKVKQMADGDFSTDLNVRGEDEISQLGLSVNHMSKELRELIASIQGSANECKGMAEELSAVSEETLATSDEMSSAVNEVAEGASKQAEDLEEANQQMQKLADQVDQASEQTNQMNDLSVDMKKANQQGLTQMKVLEDRTTSTRDVFSKVDGAVKELTNKVLDIGGVVGTISDFADQTNLLALNASIEAARAGEHGKGFAVVADEVRKLAEQSINATEKIRNSLAEVEGETRRVEESMKEANLMSNDQKNAVDDTHKSFTSIVNYIENLTISLEALTVDLKGVNHQKEQIVETMASIAHVAEGAAATAEEVSASSAEQTKAIETVGTTSEHLNDLSSNLQGKTNRFKV
ncbi:methyl-accepting chemotaxis protein [Salipaludibacillus sp. HK11]|uniref:methyl-accepting chemotaxis protein n=1 Tax=Salipaludibacillus sp. HK11 TaxID=3394320 RepID=UPI0039FBFAB6